MPGRLRPASREMVTAMPERTSDPQVIPYLLYADAGAAMDWLIRTFAFSERVRDQRSDGTVRPGELLLDNGGVIMVGSPGPGFRGPRELGEVTQLQVIAIADVSAHRDRALAAGATVSEISIWAGQARSNTVDDPKATAGTSASRWKLRLNIELLDGIGRHAHRLQ